MRLAKTPLASALRAIPTLTTYVMIESIGTCRGLDELLVKAGSTVGFLGVYRASEGHFDFARFSAHYFRFRLLPCDAWLSVLFGSQLWLLQGCRLERHPTARSLRRNQRRLRDCRLSNGLERQIYCCRTWGI
jgi:hypothetical protein